MITVDTKLVGLLGSPLGHSISAPMHNRAYKEMELDYCYLPIEVSTENLGTVFAAMKEMNFAGCNVTIPHKLTILDFLDELDPLAAIIGAVNTVQFNNGKAKGFNTDGYGFLRSLKEDSGITVKDKKVLIFGGGGAARAIAMTLASEKTAQVILCNRTREKAAELAAEINHKFDCCATAIPIEIQCKYAEQADVLINATSVGMTPATTALPCSKECIAPWHIVVDIVYNPHTTAFLHEAEKKGAKVVHGLGMLIWQAVAAFAIFTNREPAASIMQDEAKRLLYR